MEPPSAVSSSQPSFPQSSLEVWLAPRENEREYRFACEREVEAKQTSSLRGKVNAFAKKVNPFSHNNTKFSLSKVAASSVAGKAPLPVISDSRTLSFPIPDDVFKVILGFLDAKSFLGAGCVNSYWKLFVDTMPCKPDAIRLVRMEKELPPRLVAMFGGIERILDLQVFTFTDSERSRQFENCRENGDGYRPFYTAKKINWITQSRLEAPIMRFVDPHGRYGFHFFIRDLTCNFEGVLSLHEQCPIFSGFSSNPVTKWTVCQSYTSAAMPELPFDNEDIEKDDFEQFCEFFSKMTLVEGGRAERVWNVSGVPVERTFTLGASD